MSSLNKGTIKYALISGLCFAFGMAAFDYLGRVDFNLLKFAFNLLLFGFFMGLIFRPSVRNQLKKRKQNSK
jgi:hypothetical protein